MARTVETMERTWVALKSFCFFVQTPAMATLPEAMLRGTRKKGYRKKYPSIV